MRLTRIFLALSLAAALAGCDSAPDQPAASAQAHEIAWREGDVDDALAEAKESGKPVILYWGAVWCPPCNQMKSTLFKDPAFIAETRKFVPVYLDGDSQGAQRWGDQFGISGYPTVIVLRPDGTEVARLASAAMASQFADLLRVAGGRTDSTQALLARAERDPAGLSGEDWQLLAAYDWRNDPRHMSDAARAGKLISALAAAAPDPALRRRFGLLALAIGVEKDGDGRVTLSPAQQAQLAAILPDMLAAPAEVSANRLELSFDIAPMIAALPDVRQRDLLGGRLVSALEAVHADTRLSLVDRLATVQADIDLARGRGDPVPAATLAKVRERVAWADARAKDAVSRQSVMSDAAHYLFGAGDRAGAKALLEGEITTSQQPYYYMLDLASLHEEMGEAKPAIAGARKAYEAAQGPATRVQWAIAWSNTVLAMTPGDKAAVEESAAAVIDELGRNPDSYYQRTRVKVTAWGEKLRAWSEKNGGREALARLQTKMDAVCARQGTEAAACGRWSRT